ncbi:hypothetical protein CEP53_008043 [Fusarium sp. AF-6]|nr:hypothetical protein CEP53_008043 [Fusarium sp. AF-6]
MEQELQNGSSSVLPCVGLKPTKYRPGERRRVDIPDIRLCSSIEKVIEDLPAEYLLTILDNRFIENVPQHRAIDSLLIQTLASSIIAIAIVAGFEITFVILATERLIDVLLD